MNKKIISIITAAALAACAMTACGGDEEQIAYTETTEIQNAELMFAANDLAGLTNLCQAMAENNDDKATRDNFFAYFLDRVSKVDSDNDERLYATTVSVIDKCLQYPLTSATIVNGLQKTYNSIDTKMIEKTKEYMMGKWRRIDTTSLSGTVIEVQNDPEFGFISRITALPDDPDLKFRIGDIKWADIEFANHKMFFLSDMTTTETTGQKSYYKNEDSAVSSFRGATAILDPDKNTITVTYDRASSVTSGARQVWVKVGTENDNRNAYKNYLDAEAESEKENADGNTAENENSSDSSSSKMGMTQSDSQLKDNSISNGAVGE